MDVRSVSNDVVYVSDDFNRSTRAKSVRAGLRDLHHSVFIESDTSVSNDKNVIMSRHVRRGAIDMETFRNSYTCEA